MPMSEYQLILVPYLNANDNEIEVTELPFDNGSKVIIDQTVVNIESTKTAFEVVAPINGFFYTQRSIGDRLKIGEVLAVISVKQIDDKTFSRFISEPNNREEGPLWEKFSDRAKAICIEKRLDPGIFSRFPFVSHVHVIEYLAEAKIDKFEIPIQSSILNEIDFADAILLYGDLNTILIVLDILIDDAFTSTVVCVGNYDLPPNTPFNLIKITPNWLPQLVAAGLKKYFRCQTDDEYVELAGLENISIVSSRSHVSVLSSIGLNTLIGKGVTIGPLVTIDDNVVIMQNCSIAHHSHISTDCFLGDGSVLGGNVCLESSVYLGLGVKVNKRITIGDSATVVSGATVIDDVVPGTVVR